jgi:hypothetical protein
MTEESYEMALLHMNEAEENDSKLYRPFVELTMTEEFQ